MIKRASIFLFFYLTLLWVPAYAYQAAVVSAHPDASKVGIEILKNGGNAADAAVATAFALSVVEPHNSGLGGGGFLLYYDARLKKYSFVDYRETAPAGAAESLYKNDPSKLYRGILSVAIPGFVKGMETIHQKWGILKWADLVKPSAQLAREGIPLKGKLEEKISKAAPQLRKDPAIASLYLEPFEKSENRIDQTDLATTLEQIQNGGSSPFYTGPLAQQIAQFMKNSGGLITAADLKNYSVQFRRPYQFEYGSYNVMTAPQPSSGGAALSLLFKKAIINGLDKSWPFTPEAYGLIMRGIKDYFEYREIALGDTGANITSHTTHLSIIDQDGNMAAMTNTLNSPFGAAIVVPGTGIILNNEMADFSLKPGSPNAVRGGRRPLSSMAPTIVLKKGNPYLIIGTPGGVNIPVNLYQIFLFAWDWKAPLSTAIAKPKVYYSPMAHKIVVEPNISNNIREELQSLGTVEEQPETGNVQALIIQSEKRTTTLSDPRGEGKGFTL